ncbi:transposase [Thalassotalea psychrophila]|uniref:Transposase n=1 Tax=Thalassotalea psychrophila TaxID=3065647 RepID=A0ABY9U276_9GAMM|nr:transposase [Colwelliaceae bacterium SQ149]
MSRKPRAYQADQTAHIYLCGNNQQRCFYCTADYQYYSLLLSKGLVKYEVLLHAYVLMENHIQLLLTPSCSKGIASLIQYISSSYVRYINRKYQRSGSLFQGRHKASIVDADNYLLACMRFIESDPVSKGIVSHLAQYPYSSYTQNAVHQQVSTSLVVVNQHRQYLHLGPNLVSRKSNYQKLFLHSSQQYLDTLIIERLMHNFPIGDEFFIEHIEALHHIKFNRMKLGRPSKPVKLMLPVIFC